MAAIVSSSPAHRVLEADRKPTGHPREEVLDKLELLTVGHLWPDQVEEHGGGEDGAAVDHGVVGLPVGVQRDLVTTAAARLLAHQLGHALRAKMGQAAGVKRFGACSHDKEEGKGGGRT